MKLFDSNSSNFVVVYDRHIDPILLPYVNHIARVFKYDLGLFLPVFDDYAIKDSVTNDVGRLGKSETTGKLKNNRPIVINSDYSNTCKELKNSLAPNSYAIKIENDTIYIAFTSNFAAIYALDRFEKEFITNDNAELPKDYFVSETVLYEDSIITSPIKCMRDPYMVIKDGIHYLFGTEWQVWKNESKTIKDNNWVGPRKPVVVEPSDVKNHRWAPEVHYYNGYYYLFTAYLSTKNDRRGVHIFRTDDLEKPFEEYSDGAITPDEWDAIDGTLYVDKDGQPWLVFVNEWTRTNDGMGRMDIAKLSPDLHHLISEPIEIFRADDASFCKSVVTDGPEMYTTKDNELLMIWSSSDSNGYFEAICRSKSGTIMGPWIHESELYSKKISNTHDGGHGMIFTDNDGQMYLTLHSPNHETSNIQEVPRFIPIRESAGTLVWDLFKK